MIPARKELKVTGFCYGEREAIVVSILRYYRTSATG